MHDHLENIRKIDEYKSRVKARYNLKKQPKKYCISGVKFTDQGNLINSFANNKMSSKTRYVILILGPVYIISGVRPPVECECGKVLREKEEMEAHEKIRAILPNTGRMKYEIAGTVLSEYLLHFLIQIVLS